MPAAGKLISLAQADLGKLDDAELRLFAAAAQGRWIFPGPSDDSRDASNNPVFAEEWGHGRRIRASVLRWLCVTPEARPLVDANGVLLGGAIIAGPLELNYAEIPFPVFLARCRLEQVKLTGCQIAALGLEGCWTGEIIAERMIVKHSLFLARGFQARGIVSLVGAQIGGNLECEGGTFLNPGGDAINADYASVAGAIHLRADREGATGQVTPFVADGAVRMYAASVGGDIDCRGGTFRNPRGTAILLQSASAKGGIFFLSGSGRDSAPEPRFSTFGTINLLGASTSAFLDDPASWPRKGELQLDGFVYNRVPSEGRDGATRLRWLELDTSDATQPYRQLAKVLQDSGHTTDAKLVLQAMEAKLSRKNDPVLVQQARALIGYGYKPERAAVGLGLLTAVGALLYWRGQRMGAMVPTDREAGDSMRLKLGLPAHYRRFQPVIYSLENTFSLVKLGQTDKWQPEPAPATDKFLNRPRMLRWFIWVQAILGPLITLIFLASVSGLVQRG